MLFAHQSVDMGAEFAHLPCLIIHYFNGDLNLSQLCTGEPNSDLVAPGLLGLAGRRASLAANHVEIPQVQRHEILRAI